MKVEARLQELGLVLPGAPTLPPGTPISFAWTRIYGNRIYVSGQGPLNDDGVPRGPFGKVPSEVSLEGAQDAARKAALCIVGSLKRALSDLDRVTAWLMVNGAVNADPGYSQTTLVINAFSDLILDLYGPEVGMHARTAFGVAALPLNNAVVVSAEVAFE